MVTSWRLPLLFGLLLVGGVLHVRVGGAAPYYFYATAALLGFIHFRFHNVLSAYGALRKGQLEKAERLLRPIRRPAWLARRHRAYYYLTLGMIDLQHKRLPSAGRLLQQAVSLGLPQPREQALALLNLAHIEFAAKRYPAARDYLGQARAIPADDLLLRQGLKELERALERNG